MLNLSGMYGFFLEKFSRFREVNSEPVSYQLDTGSLSDIGRSRSVNQDLIGVFSTADGHDFVAVVADGMGGHKAGDIASRMAVEEIQHSIFVELEKQSPKRALREVFGAVNSKILEQAEHNPDYQGMGTTLVVLVLHQSSAYFAHTGDSRLYLVRNYTIQQMTEDHTLVAEMLQQGLIDPEQAKNHPNRNVITHAVGTKRQVFVDFSNSPMPLQIGDCFLLCSDGLYDLVDETEMLNYASTHSAQQACEELVRLANKRGGYDNISVIIVKILEAARADKTIPITRV